MRGHSLAACSPVRCRVDGLHCRLNLLIAIMGDSYEKVKESERVEAIRERARIVVEMEKRFPTSHRYHRFMHFVELADAAGRPQESVWEGATRRVTAMMRMECGMLEDELKGNLAELKGELIGLNGEMNAELGQLKGEMNQMNTKLELLDSKLQAILDNLK